MNCPRCGDDTRVSDSRPTAQGFSIRRRRICKGCGSRFTTFETTAEHRGVWTQDQQDRFARLGIAMEVLMDHWHGLQETRRQGPVYVQIVPKEEDAA